jgi:hypothetical protein
MNFLEVIEKASNGEILKFSAATKSNLKIFSTILNNLRAIQPSVMLSKLLRSLLDTSGDLYSYAYVYLYMNVSTIFVWKRSQIGITDCVAFIVVKLLSALLDASSDSDCFIHLCVDVYEYFLLYSYTKKHCLVQTNLTFLLDTSRLFTS